MPLADVAIRSAKPGEKPIKLSDGKGMFLLVTPAGGKLWRLKYRLDGREKLLAMGAYPEVSLSDARKRRDDARALDSMPLTLSAWALKHSSRMEPPAGWP
jgi:hypothetical protein